MIRKNIFWSIDKIKGEKVKRQLEDVDSINSHPASGESLEKKQSYLNNILEHAVKTTDFYSDYSGFSSITDFPVINKNVIREEYDRFKSEPAYFSKAKVVSTSGSTGTPFKVHHCIKKQRRNRADNLYFSQFGEYEVGDPFCYLRIWNEVNKKSKLHHFMYNTYPIDISDLSDSSLVDVVGKINKLPEEIAILAYGSTLEVLTDFLIRNDITLKVHPKCFIVMAEPIHKKVRDYLSSQFNCKVLSRYSNSENGFLGHQWSMKYDEYMINTASYHINLLEMEKDIPVKNGQPGRIVVTDLFNHAIPFIRYDTGDVGIEENINLNGRSVPVFKTIEGRKLDFIYNTSGELISPHSIDYAVRQTPGLIQFQIIQESSTEYTLKLLLNNRKGDYEDEVIQKLRHYLGGDAKINIEYISEIPVLSSGKRKIVVNNWNC